MPIWAARERSSPISGTEKLLFPYQGLARLVLPADKEGARSVRMLEKLEVVELRK